MPRIAPTSAYERDKRYSKRNTQAAIQPSQLSQNLQQPQALLEELQMVRLEGRYFCFDRHVAKARSGVLEYRDGNRGLVIEVSPRFGHPSVLAYKVLQAVFKKITEAGKPYPDTIVLGKRELGRLVGRDSFGGRDALQLHQAISQLRSTNVELYLYEDTKDSAEPESAKAFKTWSFSILANLGFVGTGDATQPQHIHAAILRLDATIADNLRAGHFAIYNWERLEGMEPLTAALYKRLYLHFSNLYETQYSRHNLKFEKDYEAICAEWLGGLKPERYKSRIAQQLQPHFDALIASGLVREASIQTKAQRQGRAYSQAYTQSETSSFKLVFKPNDGFFADYEVFYLKAPKQPRAQSPIKASTSITDKPGAELLAPMQAVAHFYQQLHGVSTPANDAAAYGDGHIYAQGDIAFASRMIDKLGMEGLMQLIDFAIVEAKRTRFAMQSIRAIETYLAAWQIKRSHQIEKQAQYEQEQLARRNAQKHEQQRAAYTQFCEAQCEQYAASLTDDERQALHDAALAIAETKALPESPLQGKTHGLMLSMTKRELIAKHAKLPTFEAWLAQQKK